MSDAPPAPATPNSDTGRPPIQSSARTAGQVPIETCAVHRVYSLLFEAYGAQQWWPAETRFEVMVGAVLTQNTAWTNVERAIAQLRERIPLAADAVLALPESELALLIRPVGYFNVKARRLRAFCAAFLAAGGESSLSMVETDRLRDLLLGIHGVGPETADDMLLYAFERPVFVIDAYTRRLFERLGVLGGGESYETLRMGFEQALDPDPALFNEYHALIVHHAKHVCRARAPRCDTCCLAADCPQPGSSPTP